MDLPHPVGYIDRLYPLRIEYVGVRASACFDRDRFYAASADNPAEIFKEWISLVDRKGAVFLLFRDDYLRPFCSAKA